MRWYFILSESIQSAYRTIILNKLRTFLSLLGVTIGIFSIVSVFSVLDSMKVNMRKSLEAFGTDIVVIESMPWGPEGGEEYAWWEYIARPQVTLKEYNELKSRTNHIEAACFIAGLQTSVEYLDNRAENLQIWGVSEEFEGIRTFDLAAGRFLTLLEINSGRTVCVIGAAISEDLFGGDSPVGKTIRFQGKKCSVIGVFKREGKSILNGGSIDKVIVTPIRFFGTFADLHSMQTSPQIWVKPIKTVAADALKDELRIHMRSIRRLSPRVKNNFALNKTSMMTNMIDQIFGVVNAAGWIIGIFAVLVGAFGIANIMFVSVKERTRIIGIQKALGAKNFYIVLEVLNESVTLSLLGGSLGLFLIYLGTLIARSKDFEIFLSGGNIVFGLLISSTVGVIAGLLPAFTAARLDPVKAISSTF